MKSPFLAVVACVSILGLAPSLEASEEASRASVSLARENAFALGGVGVAGTMSGGEKDLRALLKEADAVQQLQSLLKSASPAGQLYALLGLRLRDRPAYDQAVPAFRKRSDEVSTLHGCIMMKEKMDAIVRQIEHGDYDTSLTRDPW
jgi:hypothetical protein